MNIVQTETEIDRGRSVPILRSPRGWLVAAALMALFFLLTSIYIGAHRLFWYDELFTVLISKLPNTSTILDGLFHADNNMPAPYFLVVHFFLKLVPDTEVAARLPSALALAAGLMITFACGRRVTDGLHGLMAVGLLGCTLLPVYGYEARSYSIYFMFAALAFWIWTQTPESSRLAAALFGITIFSGMLFHYYTLLCLVPFATWEALQWRPWRPPSLKLIAGLLGIACAAVLLARQIFGANKYSAVFWSKPTLSGLRGTFSELFPDGLFLLALLILLVTLWGPGRKTEVAHMGTAESVGWLCLLMPFAGYILALRVTNAFVARYFIGMLPGVAIAFAAWFHRHFLLRRRLSLGVLLVLIGSAVCEQWEAVRRPELIQQFSQQTETRQMLQIEDSLRAEGKRFFLCSNGMLYVEVDHYSHNPESYRLFIPPADELRLLNTVRYAMGLARYYPYHFWSLSDLRNHVQETALIAPSEYTLNLLRSVGIRSIIRYRGSIEVAYLE